MRRLVPTWSFAASLLLFAGHGSAQQSVPDRVSLPPGVSALGPVSTQGSDRYRFESRNVGKPFIVDVVRVEGPFPSAHGRLPVVFVTDNDAWSTLVPAMARAGSLELFPPMLVVGIGYDTSGAATPLEGLAQFGIRRGTDFTPTVDDSYFAELKNAVEQLIGAPWPEDASLGGAGAFLAFIDRELKPFLAAHYPADVDDATLIGHSLGGLFTLHVLFTSPSSFDRYIALSPAANYDDGVLFREEAALGNVAARVFIGLGGDDLPLIVESTPRLDAQIRARARPGLRYTYKLFPGETHVSIVPGGLMAGLRAVFDAPAPPGPPGAAPEAAAQR